jgi:predicted Zn-dependent peptidase
MVEKLTLPNGVRILHQKLDHVRSCALGVWVESGSRHEPADLCGISHFIEHMLFKGTETYTAGQLAEEFDGMGGQVNAFTTKEHTCFYGRTLDTHVQHLAELLCDMYLHSRFAKEDTDLERGVIIEEIGMYEDTPEDLVSEQLMQQAYPNSALGRPILGYKETLQRMCHTDIADYCRSRYTGKNTIVSICGSFSPEDLDAICRLFGQMDAGERLQRDEAVYQPTFVLKKKDIEQNHLIVLFPGLPLGSDERFVLQVLNNVLGAGMSSRLFQRVREQSGLCYTIYSFQSGYLGTGVFGVYVALGRETEDKAIKLIRQVIAEFLETGCTQEELDRTITQLKANLLMGLEGTTARMNGMARNEFLYGRQVEPEELIAGLEAVTCDDVLQLARELLRDEVLSFSAVGKVRSEEEYRTLLEI